MANPPRPPAIRGSQTHQEMHLLQVQRFTSGPLPDPDILARYDQIAPGTASKIIGMAVSQSNHRQEMERFVVESNAKAQHKGQIMGFILALLLVGVGTFLVYTGKSTAGATVLGIDVIGLVSIFVYGKREQRLERQDQLRLRNPEQ